MDIRKLKAVQEYVADKIIKAVSLEIPQYQFDEKAFATYLDYSIQSFVVQFRHEVFRTTQSKTLRKVENEKTTTHTDGQIAIGLWDYILIAIGLSRYARTLPRITQVTVKVTEIYEVTENHCPHIKVPDSKPHMLFLSPPVKT